jgi:hypothetical protein
VTEPLYQPRHINNDQLCELINLYHLARTALSGKDDSRYQRMLWASREFHKLNPLIGEAAAYKDLSNSLSQ